MRRLVTATNHVLCALTAIAWLAAAALPATAQQEAERQTRLLLPRAATQTGPTLMLQAAHIGPATCMALRADGKKLASGGEDGYAIIYDVETGVVERTFPWHPCALTSVSLSPDGHYLACGLTDGQVVVWDLTGKAEPAVLGVVLSDPRVNYSPQSKYLAVHGLNPHPDRSLNRDLRLASQIVVSVWDAAGTRAVSNCYCGGILGLAFSPDDRTLTIASPEGAWDADLSAGTAFGKRERLSFRALSWKPAGRPTYESPFSPGPGVIAPATGLMAVKWINDFGSGRGAGCRWRPRWEESPGTRAWGIVDVGASALRSTWVGRGDAVAFSPDGTKLLEAGGGELCLVEGRLRDLRTGEKRLLLGDTAPVAHRGALRRAVVGDVVITPDGKRATAAWWSEASVADGIHSRPPQGLGTVTWSLEIGDQLGAWWVGPGRDAVLGLVADPAGPGILAAFSSGQCARWGLSGAAGIVANLPTSLVMGHRHVQPEPDAPGEAPGGVPITRSKGLAGPGAVNRDGTMTTDGAFDAVQCSLNDRLAIRLTETREGGVVSYLERPTGLDWEWGTARRALWVSADRRWATLGLLDTSVTVHDHDWVRHPARVAHWSLPDGRLLWAVTLPQAVVPMLPCPDYYSRLRPGFVFSPDGRFLAQAWGYSPVISVWDLATGADPLDLEGHTDAVLAASFSPDGRVLASASADGTARLWDLADGRSRTTLTGHLGAVTSVCFTPDGRLATGSLDGSIALWDSRHWLLAAAERRLAATPAGRWPRGLARRALGTAGMLASGLLGWLPDAPAARDPHQVPSPSLGATLVCFAPPLGSSVRKISELQPTQASLSDVDPDWLVAVPQGCYDCSPDASGRVAWLMGDRVYPFDQFEDQTRRPDIVRSVLAGRGVPRGAGLRVPHAPPEVEFRSPTYGALIPSPASGSFANDMVEVTLAARGAAPIQRVTLLVNGRPVGPGVAAQLTVASPGEGERVFTCSLPIMDADARLHAVAHDTDGLTSRPAELLLHRDLHGASRAGLLVLSIGISKYANPAWNTLQYANADALAIADLVATKVGDLKHRQVLADQAAGVSSVKFALRNLKDTATEADTVVVFIAGHGVQGPGDDYYFLCHDSTEGDLANTALPWTDFVNLLSETRARRVMLFADTCHSGFVTGTNTAEQRTYRLNRDGGVMVFAASKGNEASIEGEEWGHGAFTFALMAGLNGAADRPDRRGGEPQEVEAEPGDAQPQAPAGDGYVTANELGDYVVREVTRLSNDRQHPLIRLDQFPAHQPLLGGTRADPGIRALAFSPDGRTLLSLDPQGTLYNVSQDPPAISRRLLPADGPAADPTDDRWAAGAFSPDGRWVATWANRLSVWDASTGALRERWEGPPDEFRFVQFGPDSVALAAGGAYHYTHPISVEQIVFPAEGDFGEYTLARGLGFTEGGLALANVLRDLDQSRRVGPGDRDYLRLTPVRGPLQSMGQLLGSVLGHPRPSPQPRLDLPPIRDCSYPSALIVRDRLLLVCGQAPARDWPSRPPVLRVCELASGRVLRELPLPFYPTSMCASANARRLSCLGEKGVCVVDLESGSTLCSLPDPASPYTAIALSPDGATLATGTESGAIQLWDVATGTPRATVRAAADAPE